MKQARASIVVWALVWFAAAPTSADSPVLYYSTGEAIVRVMLSDGILQEVVPRQSANQLLLIRWVQLVPALERLYWSESRYSFSTDADFWSSDLNGEDIRAEFGVVGGVIDSAGESIYYYYAEPDAGFARVNLDGSGAELLGFGATAETGRFPGINPTRDWLYFSAASETTTPLGNPIGSAVFRGNVSTGSVQQLWETASPFAIGHAPKFLYQFDELNGVIHGIGYGLYDTVHDDNLVQFAHDGSNQIEVIGVMPFFEGEGGSGPLYTFVPEEREYYYVRPSTENQDHIYRIAYDDILGNPSESEIIARSEIVYSFPLIEGSTDRWINPFTLEFDPTHTIAVPEPGSLPLTAAGLASVLLSAALVRRRRLAPFGNHTLSGQR